MYDGGSLRTRIPGQSVLNEVVRTYLATPKRSRFARILGASPLTAENRSWYRGALGELAVGRALDHLDPEWDVLHAVPIGAGNSDIDHVVVGPGGVFTINTKNHTGHDVWVAGSTFMVSGQRQPHIRNSIFEAKRSAKLLSEAAGYEVVVTPVIVVVDPKRLTLRATTGGVRVIESRQLERWFQRLPRVLTGAEVAAISDVADRSSTWQAEPATEQDTQQLYRDFTAIRDEVRTAIRRRVLWGVGTLLVGYTVIWSALAAIVANAVGVG